MSTSQEPAAAVAQRILEGAGGEACVLVDDMSEVDVRFANNTITSDGRRRLRRVSVVRYVDVPGGRSAGSASATGDVDVEALLGAAELDALSAAPADDAAGLLDGGQDGDAYLPAPEVEPSSLSALLGELGEVLRRSATQRRVAAGFVEGSVVTTTVASTAGTMRRHVTPTAKVQLTLRDISTGASVWAGSGAGSMAGLSLAELEASLDVRLGWSTRRIDLPAGRYRTILPPDAVADMVPLAAQAASGRDAMEGHNVYSAPGSQTRIGQRLFDVPFNLRSDPDEPGLEAIPFVAARASSGDVSVFDNGAPIGRQTFVEDGILRRLLWSRAGAARAGAQATFPGDNLILELPGSASSTQDLISGTDRALLVTCLWYIREVDPATLLLTGLTRDGVYLVEAGEVVAAVNNFRFNESPLDVLARVSATGRTERALSREWNEWFPRTAMPGLVVEDFNFSSVSPAT
ncbi:MAG: metallopeptidase TldD-related protein [Acidimicrobiales bacterium]